MSHLKIRNELGQKNTEPHLSLVFSDAHCELALLMLGRLGIHLDFCVAHAKIPDTANT